MSVGSWYSLFWINGVPSSSSSDLYLLRYSLGTRIHDDDFIRNAYAFSASQSCSHALENVVRRLVCDLFAAHTIHLTDNRLEFNQEGYVERSIRSNLLHFIISCANTHSSVLCYQKQLTFECRSWCASHQRASHGIRSDLYDIMCVSLSLSSSSVHSVGCRSRFIRATGSEDGPQPRTRLRAEYLLMCGQKRIALHCVSLG